MRVSRSFQAVVLTTVFAAVFLIAGHTFVHAAQDPAPAQPAPAHHHERPAPTNLKVLPRNLNGEQVHEIMEQWEGELGTTCKTCHTVDKTKKSPDGKLVFNYADDSKEEKQTARLMFKMVDEINTNYVAKIDSSGAPVTCGTCHRGHLGPESFVPAPPHAHDHVD
jgi:Photosynthetic reaction centre cytochrome C subunit